jgi:hypothetical protein
VKNAQGVTCSPNRTCNYTTCNTGSDDCDTNRTNGCECACGTVNNVCCPGSTCQGTAYCGGGTCRACKAVGADCSAEIECCSGNCHANGRCR